MRELVQERIVLARDGFMTQTVDRVPTGYRPTFDCALLPQPILRHTQWDHGDVTSRALTAWHCVREITGDHDTGREIEEGLWQHLQSVLHPQTGMAFVPEHSDSAGGHYYYHMWDQGRTMGYLVLRLKSPFTPAAERDTLRQRVRRLQQGVLAVANKHRLPDGTEALAWPLDVFWNRTPGLPEGREFGDQNWFGFCIATSQLLGPQVELAEWTGEAGDLDLAMQIARGFLAGLEQRRGSTMPMFGPDGAFRGHWHGAISGVDGLVKLARYLWRLGETPLAQEWIELAARVYHWIFDRERNVNPVASCGLCPESASDQPWSSSELCCTADLIELITDLGPCAALRPEWSELADTWDVLERAARNELLNMQFTQPEKLVPHLLLTSGLSEAEARARLSRMIGLWNGSRSYLNDLGYFMGSDPLERNLPALANHPGLGSDTPALGSGGCCAYSGVRGLYAVWKHAVVQCGDGTEVRVPMSHRDANVTLEGAEEGVLRFSGHRKCWLRIRRPTRVAPEAISISGAPAPVTWSDDKRWLTLSLEPGDTGELRWPLIEWQTHEVAGPTNNLGILAGLKPEDRLECQLTYRGNTVVGVEPAPLRFPYQEGL